MILGTGRIAVKKKISQNLYYQSFYSSQGSDIIKGKKVKVKVAQSCPTLFNPWNSPGQNTGVGSLSLLQGIFPTQESNWGLLNYRQILYQLSYRGSPYKMNMNQRNRYILPNLDLK